MEIEKVNIDTLGDLYRMATGTIATFDRLLHLTDDLAMGSILNESLDECEDIASDIDSTLALYGKKPRGISELEKTASNAIGGIHTGLQTLFDKSNSRLAGLVMQAMLDDIITCYRLMRKNKLDIKVSDINRKLIKMSEKTLEAMKKFL